MAHSNGVQSNPLDIRILWILVEDPKVFLRPSKERERSVSRVPCCFVTIRALQVAPISGLPAVLLPKAPIRLETGVRAGAADAAVGGAADTSRKRREAARSGSRTRRASLRAAVAKWANVGAVEAGAYAAQGRKNAPWHTRGGARCAQLRFWAADDLAEQAIARSV